MSARPTLSGHGRIVCVCGILIAQCRCLRNHEHTETRSPCTHQRMAVGDIDPTRSKTRHIIRDSHSDTEIATGDGLAFSLGVATVEAFTTRDVTRYYTVCHPNGVPLYHVNYVDSGNVVVTNVGA